MNEAIDFNGRSPHPNPLPKGEGASAVEKCDFKDMRPSAQRLSIKQAAQSEYDFAAEVDRNDAGWS